MNSMISITDAINLKAGNPITINCSCGNKILTNVIGLISCNGGCSKLINTKKLIDAPIPRFN